MNDDKTQEKNEPSKNQCQGCQANWETEVWMGTIFHYVDGGYKGEKVVCTKDRYE